MDVAQIRELIKLVEQSDINEVLVEEGDVKITVRKGAPIAVQSAGAPTPAAVDAKTPAAGDIESYPEHWVPVKAPMVGTFYRAPGPGAEPFVEIDHEVESGQTLCILEAMKLMNEITAEDKGVIKRILVDNAAPVEYGQILFLLEPI